jgi:hypothetical protein
LPAPVSDEPSILSAPAMVEEPPAPIGPVEPGAVPEATKPSAPVTTSDKSAEPLVYGYAPVSAGQNIPASASPAVAEAQPLPAFTPVINTTGPVAAPQSSQPADQQNIAAFVPAVKEGGPTPDPNTPHQDLPAFTPVTNTTGPIPAEEDN